VTPCTCISRDYQTSDAWYIINKSFYLVERLHQSLRYDLEEGMEHVYRIRFLSENGRTGFFNLSTTVPTSTTSLRQESPSVSYLEPSLDTRTVPGAIVQLLKKNDPRSVTDWKCIIPAVKDNSSWSAKEFMAKPSRGAAVDFRSPSFSEEITSDYPLCSRRKVISQDGFGGPHEHESRRCVACRRRPVGCH
jgi:hypothetical protein